MANLVLMTMICQLWGTPQAPFVIFLAIKALTTLQQTLDSWMHLEVGSKEPRIVFIRICTTHMEMGTWGRWWTMETLVGLGLVER